jgi:hypothetical protein
MSNFIEHDFKNLNRDFLKETCLKKQINIDKIWLEGCTSSNLDQTKKGKCTQVDYWIQWGLLTRFRSIWSKIKIKIKNKKKNFYLFQFWVDEFEQATVKYEAIAIFKTTSYQRSQKKKQFRRILLYWFQIWS